MVVSIDEDYAYGPDPGLHSPETPGIRSSMAHGQAALFSLDRSRRAQAEARYLPITSQVLAASVHKLQGNAGPRKWPEIFRNSAGSGYEHTEKASLT